MKIGDLVRFKFIPGHYGIIKRIPTRKPGDSQYDIFSLKSQQMIGLYDVEFVYIASAE